MTDEESGFLDENNKINEDAADNEPLLNNTCNDEERLPSTDTEQDFLNYPYSNLPQYLAAYSATMGAFCVGTALAWTSPTEERLRQGALGFKMTDSEISWTASIFGLGSAFACLFGGTLIDRLGRRTTMRIITLPFALGWLFVALAINVPMLYFGRILTGACAGIFSVANTIYVSEIAHPKSRGFLGTFFQLQICLGLEFVYIVGPMLPVLYFSVICGILPLINCLLINLFVPESPVYLLRNGQSNGAYASLKHLRGSFYDPQPELESIANSNPEPADSWGAILHMLLKRPMIVCAALMTFQQLTGINDIVFYTEEIFKDAGGSVKSSDAAAIVGGVQLGATILSSMVVDKTGRRVLLMISGAVLAACCTALGFYFQFKTWGHDMSHLSWLPLSSLCLYFAFFSLGFGPIPWILIGELFAPDIRGSAAALNSSLSWLLTFLVTFVFEDVVQLIGEGITFWAFATFCIIGVLFVALFVPETKGKTLTDIQRELGLARI